MSDMYKEGSSQHCSFLLLTTLQCSLDLSFLRGPAKINDEYGKTINPKHHFFNKQNHTLSFASWKNFASIENMTFQGLKCVHGPRQLHCAHRNTLNFF
jgi:hypothetical protein